MVGKCFVFSPDNSNVAVTWKIVVAASEVKLTEYLHTGSGLRFKYKLLIQWTQKVSHDDECTFTVCNDVRTQKFLEHVNVPINK